MDGLLFYCLAEVHTGKSLFSVQLWGVLLVPDMEMACCLDPRENGTGLEGRVKPGLAAREGER